MTHWPTAKVAELNTATIGVGVLWSRYRHEKKRTDLPGPFFLVPIPCREMTSTVACIELPSEHAARLLSHRKRLRSNPRCLSPDTKLMPSRG